MPPSPALRSSPSREMRAENHKRGRSLESGLLFREKDDDLALFKEMQTRERDDFLLQTNDDFEDAFSTKLRDFSNFKIGISIPVRGESSDLLNADGEKNDYEWLITPPDTPLFPSLDDEAPPVNAMPRGRPRSQPISISRSSTMEKSYRSSRGSASPSRSSPSPRSSNSASLSRGRPSLARHASPTPGLRNASPTPGLRNATPPQRSCTPPNKPSMPAPRSSTPTPRRISSGFTTSVGSSGGRGTSPVKVSRGNSASPKIRAWQANIPGFSTEVPPNLRTSLADRPASYVRGSSPASRSSRQSLSPTASRSVASSYSHDRDRFSSHSKGSVVSSGDDDVDSLQSIHVGSLDRSTLRKVGASPNRKPLVSSRKKVISSTSAPKSSFDSALRQRDHRKAPQNMFRPLLSSVPSSTFYVGKAGSVQRPMASRNSSVTTSSNASSDQGIGTGLETEGSDQNHDDMACESGRGLYPGVDQEIFEFDKVDTVSEGMRSESFAAQDMRSQIYAAHQSLSVQHGYFDGGSVVESVAARTEDYCQDDVIVKDTATSKVSHGGDVLSEVDGFRDLVLCSNCGCRYDASDTMENEMNLCPECSRRDILHLSNPEAEGIVAEDVRLPPVNTPELKHLDEVQSPMVVSELQRFKIVDESPDFLGEENVQQREAFSKEKGHLDFLEKSPSRYSMEGDKQRISGEEDILPLSVRYGAPDTEISSQSLQKYEDQNKVDVTEGAGISLLLKRSSSSKGPVIQGRTFTVSSIPRDDLSYARDSTNSMRSSYSRESVSGSSFVDFSSSRQTEVHTHRQLSGIKSESESYKHDMTSQSMGSSSSGVSNHTSQGYSLAASTHDASQDYVGNNDMAAEEMILAFAEKTRALEGTGAIPMPTTCPAIGEDTLKCNRSPTIVNDSTRESSSHTNRVGREDSLSFNSEDTFSLENGADMRDNSRNFTGIEASAAAPEYSTSHEHGLLNPGILDADIPADSLLVTSSEIETMKVHSRSVSELDYGSENKSLEPADTLLNASVPESETFDNVHGILEESTVTLEARGGNKARSLTLDEATDTILFCSSIVHDLAYKAATIAMEKETVVPLEGSRPTVTIVGRPASDTRDPRRGRIASKRSLKNQKARRKQVETEKKPPSSDTENDENIDESLTRNIGIPNKVDSVKPPKLESKCNCTIM